MHTSCQIADTDDFLVCLLQTSPAARESGVNSTPRSTAHLISPPPILGGVRERGGTSFVCARVRVRARTLGERWGQVALPNDSVASGHT